MNVYLLRSWTHQQSGTRVGYKPPDGTVAVMLHLGNHPMNGVVTAAWIAERLQEAGFVPEGEFQPAETPPLDSGERLGG